MPPSLTYRGVPIKLAPAADIPAAYRSMGNRAQYLQDVLDEVDPWEMGERVIETIYDLDPLPSIVIPMKHWPVVWAEHIRHQGEHVGLSPFVCAPPEQTRSFTVVLSGSPKEPILERAFPGEYIPLLPWHESWLPGEREESLAFWRTHGFIYHHNVIRQESVTVTPPDWFEK